ncbi:MAG TPA: hypothetical protein VMG12_36965 [Polyangiaceae bacterium]|nr:hypothetical protein [Polyangiaceae bacterium]
MRPTSGFSPVSGEVKKTSWDEMSRERDTDGETKNYSVPPELIALARNAKKNRSEVGTLTPLAPKPAQDVVVIVPAAPPIKLDAEDPASSLQAPSVSIDTDHSNPEPESQPTVVYSEAFKAVVSSSAAPILGDMLGTELSDDSDSQPAPAESATVRPSSSRRTSRRARGSLRIELPAEASDAARAADASAPSKPYMAYIAGGVLVCFYVLLCYYGNALLSGLP